MWELNLGFFAALVSAWALSVALRSVILESQPVKPIIMKTPADFFLLGFLISAIAFIVMCFSTSVAKFFNETSHVRLFLPTLFMQFACIGGFFIFRRFLTERFKTDIFVNFDVLVKAVKFFVGASAIVFLANIAVSLTYFWITGNLPEKQEVVDIFSQITSPLAFAMATLSIVILAPISEELIFRGIIYRLLVGLFGDKDGMPFAISRAKVLAAIVSAILFSLVHADVFVFIPLALMGICLCLVYEKTGSIVAPMVLHCLFNSINALMIRSFL